MTTVNGNFFKVSYEEPNSGNYYVNVEWDSQGGVQVVISIIINNTRSHYMPRYLNVNIS